MLKKLLTALLLILCIIGVNSALSNFGKHTGEDNMLDVKIDFFSPSGKTITNSSGVYYHYYGYVFHENKVYPPMYWGEFPLYFVGNTANIKVTVTNKGPRAKAKIRIKTESYVLNTDGSSGMPLMSPKAMEYEISRGETKVIDASFYISYQPGMESGLDRFVVKVLHINEGGAGKNKEPSLIMQKEGIFCPPKN